MDTARLTALAMRYMNEHVDVVRVQGRGAAATPTPIATGVPAYRLRQSGTYLLATGGFDATVRYKMVLNTLVDVQVKDVVVDAASIQYRVVSVQRTLPDLPVELEVEVAV